MSISYLNSLTPRNVKSGFVFAGVYDDILSAAQITTRITNTFVNNSYTLLVQYSNDKVNEVNNEIYYSTNNYNNLINFTPSSRYFKLTFTLVSGDLDNLSIETIFKSAIVYKPFVAITGTVSVDNIPAISGNVSVSNWPETSNVNIISSIALDTNVLTLPTLNITNTAFDSNIISSIALDTNVLTLPTLNITNTAFDSNIISSIALDTNVLTLPSITIANTGFTSNITAIEPTLTFQCQERPTTEHYFTTSVGTGGLAITLSPKTLRNFSFNTTSAVIVYVMLYDTGLVPIITDTPIFVFPIMNANNVIFNSFDHRFVNGLGLRAVTSYAGGGTGNPVANSVFINMTLSE